MCRALNVHAFTDLLNCPNQAYLHVQLGINALEDARYNEAADHFTAAINTGAFSSQWPIHSKYEDFVVVCYPTKICFSCSTAFFLSSSSGGTSSPCGKLQTRDGAMHSFGQGDSQKPINHSDT